MGLRLHHARYIRLNSADDPQAYFEEATEI